MVFMSKFVSVTIEVDETRVTRGLWCCGARSRQTQFVTKGERARRMSPAKTAFLCQDAARAVSLIRVFQLAFSWHEVGPILAAHRRDNLGFDVFN